MQRIMNKFIGVLMLMVSILAHADYRVEHLEPINWWVGMHNPELQLMVHGPDISALTPSVNYPGVQLVSVERTDNSNYLFINLSLSADTAAGNMEIVFKDNEAKVLKYDYPLHQRRQGSAERQGFTPHDVVYLITPDRFANGDTSNDQVESLKEGPNRAFKGGRHGGDLQGIIDHLDYISDMGFTQIWLNPVLQNDMQTYSYHGYSTTDYYQIDARYGSNTLYRELSEKGQQYGVGLIMDMVLNHIGSEHWWMRDMPAEDWINHGNNFVVTSHRREALHDPHGTQADVEGFASGWFVKSMPDLNQRNPFLSKYLIQNAVWWVEYADLSGIRVDTWSYSDKAFLSGWSKRLMQEYPKLNIVGEEWSNNPAITAYWQAGTRRHDDYDSYIPSMMDFPLQTTLIDSLKQPETWATGLRTLYEVMASDFLYGDPYNLVVFADNHDMSRVYSQLDENLQLFNMAMAYTLTTRGIPQVFYGTEILMKNPGTDDHGIIRSDFPGGWSGDVVDGFTGKGLSEQQKNTQSMLKTLMNWRKGSDAIGKGKLTHFTPEEGTYVYFRHYQDDVVMVVLNKNTEAKTLPLGRFSQFLQKHKSAINVITQQKVMLADSLELAPLSALVLQL